MRIIELLLSDDYFKILSENGVGPIDKRHTDAIGYLSMWGFGGRAVKVRIVGDRHGELTAGYFDKDGKHVMTIGGVPDDNWVYSFHS